MADLTQSNPPKATWLQAMLAQQPSPLAPLPEGEGNRTVSPSIPKPPALRPEELSAPSSAPEADISSLLTFGTEGQPFKAGPDSGSILKVLSTAPGIKERITQGAAKGHTFQIIHMPGNPNFFLCETWTDPATSMPKKRYDPFVITTDTAADLSGLRPAPTEPPFRPSASSQPSPLAPLPKGEGKPIETSSSYDLLRNKFAKPKTVETRPEPVVSKNPLEDLMGEVYGTDRSEWERAKNMPLEAFLHPENFAWGTNADGTQIGRTLDQYPQASRALRDRIVPVSLRLANQGADLSTLTLGAALDMAAASNLL